MIYVHVVVVLVFVTSSSIPSERRHILPEMLSHFLHCVALNACDTKNSGGSRRAEHCILMPA